MAYFESFEVSAPASSGNLGPAFDVLGMALELRNVVEARPGTGTVTVSGEGADTLPTNGTNLVAAAFERAARTPITAAGVDLRCDNKIPLARGLGSSTAAAACGLIAGWTFIQHEWTEDELCTALMDLDGHPDNAAACAYGGIVLCLDRVDTDELDCITLGAADWLFPIAVIPDRELATADARRVVPTTFERRDVVRAMGASSLLVGGLMGGHIELVADALNLDVIHEPYRRELVPELADARLAAEAADALGATLSGAGPTVLVWCDQESLTRTLGTLAIDMPDHTLLELRIAAEGARVN